MQYFTCDNGRGLFVRPDKLVPNIEASPHGFQDNMNSSKDFKGGVNTQRQNNELKKKTSFHTSQEMLAKNNKNRKDSLKTASSSNLSASRTAERLTKSTAASAAKTKN